jgi:hypothetical protein
MIEPLHIGTIGGQPLRFFRSPLSKFDGKPDLPWHAVDDLHRCLGLNREQRQFFLRMLRRWNGPRPQTAIATAEGVTTIAPHFMAQGAIDAFVEIGRAAANIRDEYDRAGAKATEKLVAMIPFEFGSDDWFGWMKAAMNRWETK